MQDYKVVVRALTGGQTQFGQGGVMVSQNYSEFMSYLNEQYLGQGYVVHTITLLSHSKDVDEFAYHLVKEVSGVKTSK
jgi:hypothetical protein